MFTARVRGLGIAFVFLLLMAGGTWSMSGDAAQKRAEEPKDDKVKQLLKERLAVLQEVARMAAEEYKTGKSSFDRVHRARMAVVDARVELCESDKERIAILEEAVVLARDNEKVATQRYQAGQAPASDPLMAQAGRLDAEIALERVKNRTPARAK